MVYFNRSYQSDRNVLFYLTDLLFPVLYTAYKNNMAGIGESLYKSLICDYRTMHLPVLLMYRCAAIRLHHDLMNKWAIFSGFGCVCFWRESNVRWPASCLWNRTFNVSLGTWNFHILLNGKRPLSPVLFEGSCLCCRRLHFLTLALVTL